MALPVYLEKTMSVYNKIKLIQNKLNRETINHRFKPLGWIHIEDRSFKHDTVYCEARDYFDSVCYKYRGSKCSFVLKKIKAHPRYIHDRIFKKVMDDCIHELLKRIDHSYFRTKEFTCNREGVLVHLAEDRSCLNQKKRFSMTKCEDDGVMDFEYKYRSGTTIQRISNIYYFINNEHYTYYSKYTQSYIPAVRTFKSQLNKKELIKYGFK